MRRITKRWQVASPLTPDAERELSGFSPVLRQILFNRGYATAESAQRYLEASPPPGTSPFNMLGVPAAVERLHGAIQRREPIAIYGDYDADGVTATALLTQALQRLGAEVQGYIPHRFDEGYGLNKEALDTLVERGIRLVVTVDCGIRSPEEADYARRLGLDLIITDHHHPGPVLPVAEAIINPKQEGDAYPDKNLAGVGLAYKLAVALYERDPESPQAGLLEDQLDLVALGTVADMAPLTGENRSLVRTGMRYIHYPHRPGLTSLIGVARLAPPQITTESIGYGLAPRLNAAGRLDSALAALDLLLTPQVAQAAILAQQLDNWNRERQEITRQITDHAEQTALSSDPHALLLFAADPGYNRGVVGLAASRLTELYYRPAVVASLGEEFTRGSCRSIPEFHITDALDECADLLVHHGGHAAAAGFTVRTADLPELVTRLKGIAQRHLSSLDLRPVLRADVQLELADLRPEDIPSILQDIARLQPTGQGNPPAAFVSRDLKVSRAWTVGKEEAHLRMVLFDGRTSYDAIAFRQGEQVASLPDRIDVLYALEINVYNGRKSLQLNVKDFRPAGLSE